MVLAAENTWTLGKTSVNDNQWQIDYHFSKKGTRVIKARGYSKAGNLIEETVITVILKSFLTLPVKTYKCDGRDITVTRAENSRPYSVDSGVDIAVPKGTVVYAPADGYLLYSQYGHTKWMTPPDTPYTILMLLKEPLIHGGIAYKYLYFTHLSELYFHKPDDGKCGLLIKQDTPIGETGLGNGNEHLHFGLIVNRAQEKESHWMAPFELEALLFD
ncbi:MAG: M23 family metallopeptidase [Vulcanimicrobiota bacterium]